MIPYLVIRGKINELVENPKCIFDIIELDNINLFGVDNNQITQSLSRIQKQTRLYFDFKFKESNITVLHLNNQPYEDVKHMIQGIATRFYRTKGGSQFPETVNPTPSDRKWQMINPPKFNVWWDIENDIIFWLCNEKLKCDIEVMLSQ